jgi:hypothetical protein
VLDLLPELLRGEPFNHAHGSLTARTAPQDGCGRGRCRNGQRFDREQRAAEWKQSTAPAMGEPAEVADARKAPRQNMLQETPQELFMRERHSAALAVVRVVLPAERDVRIGHLDQAMVGDGDAMGVAGQIVQYVLRPTERLLRVHHPVFAEQCTQECGEGLLVSQRSAGSEEVEPVPAKVAPQSGYELPAKDFAQDFHRQEEMMRRADPASMLRRQSAAGHHAVHVGMLPPSSTIP